MAPPFQSPVGITVGNQGDRFYDACVIYQNINRTQMGDNLLDRPLHFHVGGNIANHCHGRRADVSSNVHNGLFGARQKGH